MNTFVYDSSPSNINTFTTQDFGSIGDAPTVTADYEIARDDIVVAEGEDLIVENDLILFVESTTDYGEINFTETTYPFGKITIGGGESASATVVFISAPEPIKLYEKAIVVRKQAWTGSGTLFEISNGLERIAAPYIGGSGPLRVSGAAVIRASDAYNESSVETYSADTNYGDLGAVGSSVDYGQVSEGSTAEQQYGNIEVRDELRPFGIFKWSSNSTIKLEKDWTKVGSGTLFNISGTTVAVSQTDDTFGLFKIFNSKIPYARTRPFSGSGSLFSLFKNEESRTFIYNAESVVAIEITESDYGSGLGAVGSTEDYGPVGGNSTGDIDFGAVAAGDETPYGSFRFSGGIDEVFNPVKRTFGHQSTGGFNFSGNVSGVQFNEPTTQIYIVTGNEVDFNTKHPFTINGGDFDAFSRGYQGSGSLFHIGDRIEKAVFSYVSTPGQTYGSNTDIDNGDLGTTTNTIDYGQVDEQSGGDTNYGGLSFFDATKFGSLRINGAATTATDSLNLGIYEASTEVLDFLPPGGLGRIRRNTTTLSGFVTQKATSSYVGVGSLFNIEGGIESKTFDYNTSSVVAIGPEENYGGLGSTTNTIDYGQVTESSTGDTDFGEAVPFANFNPFGLFNISGDTEHQKGHNFVGEGNLFSVGGLVESKSNNEAESTILFNFSGRSTIKQSDDYIGSGSLFSIGDRVEKAAYSYNESAVLEIDDPNNYGDITTTGTSVDYGSVTENAVGETDNGAIIDTDNIEPYGLFRISGAAATVAYQRFPYTGYANVRFTHQPLPTDTRYVPSYDGYYDMSLVWNNAEAYAKTTYIGSGSLFHIGDRIEKAVFHYNTSSIGELGSPNEYGDITDPVTTTIDYESITTQSDNQIDQGGITLLPGDENPFGKLFTIEGSSFEEFFPTFAWNKKSPAIRIFNEQQDPADFRFRPHWRSRHTLGTPKLRNAPDGEFNTYAQVRPFIGSGSLFNIGDKFESVTYDYNDSSIVEFTPGGSYGDITDPVTTTTDYGSVDSIASGDTDLGSIVITDIEYPYTGLFSFQGAGVSQFLRGPYVARDGALSIAGSLVERVAQTDDTDGTVFVSGDSHDTRSRDFVGSGSLFHIGDRIEKAVFHYNTSSIAEVEDSIDYGSITSSSATTSDNGLISQSSTGDTDFGGITTSITSQPFGLFSISGNSDNKWQQVFGYYGDDRDPGTSGSLFTFIGATESVTSNPPENTVLFTFTGRLTEKFSEGNYAGSGSLFHIGDRIEKAVFHYNTSSIVDDVIADGDYGSIDSNAETTSDYGSVDSQVVPPYVDQGDLITTAGEGNPFGLFKISGGAPEIQAISSWNGTGSIFALNGAAEAAVWQTPEETFLFRTSGSASEKHVENYVGTGNIKIKEETPLAPNAAVRFRPWWRSYGEINVSGDSEIEAILINYVARDGSLKLFTHDEGDEWLRYRPSPRYVNSIYGKIGGSAIVNGDGGTRKINVYGYYGDDRDPGTSGSLFGFGGGAESFSTTQTGNEDITFFTFNGEAKSKFNPHWRGRPDGSPRLSGTPDLVLRFNIFTNPEVEKFIFDGTSDLKITLTYDGSGSLFAVGGSTETRGFNPDLETILFSAGGRGTTLFSLLHVGSGSFFGLGGGAESRTIQVPESTTLFVPSGASTQKTTRDFIGEGSTSLSGNLVERQTDSYLGEGSLFSAGGASESSTNTKEESTVLFVPSGTASDSRTRSAVAEGSITVADIADEAFTRPYIGSGSLFSVGGLSESVGVVEESTGLFTFVGNAAPTRSRDFVGSGSLFGFSGAGEAVAVSPDDTTGLFTIYGDSTTARSLTHLGSGSEFIDGNLDEAFTRPYTGEGQLSTFGGGAEVAGFDPTEETLLYTTQGNATVVATNAFAGSGTENVSGEAVPVIALSFVGSGNLSTFGGGAESRTIDVENITLFETRGTATERFTRGSYNPEGSANISGEVSDIKITYGNQVFAYASVSGNLDESQTDSYVGSGSLFSLNSSTISRSIAYDETETGAQGEVVSTNIFTITGNNPGSVTRITQPETARFKVTGQSVNVLKLFSPIRIFGTII